MEIYNHKKYWNDFLNGKIAVNCPIEESAKEFLTWCDSGGLKWGDGNSLMTNNGWGCHKKETSYQYGNYGMVHCRYEFYIEYNTVIKVVQFQGFTN